MALWYAAFLLAFIPPIADLAGADQVPWSFNTAVCAGSALASVVWLWVSKNRVAWRTMRHGLVLVPLVFLCLSRVQHALFVWASHYSGFAVTTVLFRMWPLVMMGAIAFLTRTSVSLRAALMTCGATVLAAVVIVSQYRGAPANDGHRLSWLLLGSALALAAAIISGIGPAAGLAVAWRSVTKTEDVKTVAIAWFAIACIVMIVPNYAISVTFSESFTVAGLVAGFAVGMLNGGAYTMIVSGNAAHERIGKNAALVASPMLSLGILHVVGTTLDSLTVSLPAAAGAILLAVLASSSPQESAERHRYAKPVAR